MKLQPLTAESDVGQPFPLDAFPPPWNEFAAALARAKDVCGDMVGAQMIGVIGAAAVGLFDVRYSPEWKEAVNLQVLQVAHAGEGKSRTLSELTAPLYAGEKTLCGEVLPTLKKNESDLKNLDAKITAKRRALKGREGDSEIESQIAALNAELAELEKNGQRPVSFILQDTTSEALEMFLCRNSGRAAIVTDERNTLSTLGGSYNPKGSSNVDALKSGYDGGRRRVSRVGRDDVLLDHIDVSILWSVQPVAFSAYGKGALLEDGTITRLIMCKVPDMVDERIISDEFPETPALYRALYSDLIGNLIRLQRAALIGGGRASVPEKITLEVDAEARAIMQDFRREVLTWTKTGGPFHSSETLRECASRFPGNGLRVAAVMMLLRQNGLVGDGVIVGDDMRRAVEVMRYAASHTLALLQDADAGENDLQIVLEIAARVCDRGGGYAFKRADIVRALRRAEFRGTEGGRRIDAALRDLTELGYLRKEWKSSFELTAGAFDMLGRQYDAGKMYVGHVISWYIEREGLFGIAGEVFGAEPPAIQAAGGQAVTSAIKEGENVEFGFASGAVLRAHIAPRADVDFSRYEGQKIQFLGDRTFIGGDELAYSCELTGEQLRGYSRHTISRAQFDALTGALTLLFRETDSRLCLKNLKTWASVPELRLSAEVFGRVIGAEITRDASPGDHFIEIGGVRYTVDREIGAQAESIRAGKRVEHVADVGGLGRYFNIGFAGESEGLTL